MTIFTIWSLFFLLLAVRGWKPLLLLFGTLKGSTELTSGSILTGSPYTADGVLCSIAVIFPNVDMLFVQIHTRERAFTIVASCLQIGFACLR